MRVLMLGSGSIRSNFMYRLLSVGRALAKRGHHVSIIAPSADKYNDFVPDKTKHIEGVHIIHPFQFATKRLEINLLPYLLAAAWKVWHHKADVVYIYKPTPISVVGMIAKLRGVPVVVDMDDLGAEVMRIEGHPAHLRILVERSEKFAAKHANALVLASTFLIDEFKKKFPKKPTLWITNGVEADWFGPVEKPDFLKRIVVFAFFNRKSITEPLFDVLPEVRKAHPDVRLLVIGDGQYLQYFKDKVAGQRMEDCVTFTGFLPLAEAKKHLLPGDIGYNYMPDERTVRAANNMKVPQFMSRGVVPLVSRVGDLPWMIDNGAAGYVAEPDDVSSLTEAFIKALADPGRKVKSKHARAYASEHFRWDKLAVDVEVMLKSLCDGAN